jgi:hypothetical protein
MADEIPTPAPAENSAPAAASLPPAAKPPEAKAESGPAADLGSKGTANGKPGFIARVVASLPGKKRGPKGPWKHKKEAGEILDEAPLGILPADAPKPPVVAPGFIKKTVRAFLGVIDGLVIRKVYTVTEKLTGDTKQASNFAEQAAMTKEEAELIAELTAVVAKKHGLTEETSPEILLGVAVIGYTTRTILVVNRLNELAKLHAPAPANKSQAA